MDNFDQQTVRLDIDLYGFGPWYISSDTAINYDHTWIPITADWVGAFNQIINDLVPKKSVVVQAGGWQGVYPFLLSNMFSAVYTFEPDPKNFHFLVKNCQKENIFKFNAALSDKPGVVQFDRTPSSGQHRIHHGGPLYDIPVLSSIGVPALSVDSLNLPDLSFLMVDVENYENQVIDGALGTILKYSPVICIEKSFLPENDEKIDDKLTGIGYKKVVDLNTNAFYSMG